MENGEPNSFKEGGLIEVLIIDARFKQVISVVTLFPGIFFIKESIDDNGQTGVEDIVELVDIAVKEDDS